MCEKYNSRALERRRFGATVTRFARLGGRLWPAVCVVCRRTGESGLDLCPACRACLPGLVTAEGTLCPHCGEASGDPLSEGVCARCAARPSPFARLVVPWRYAFPLDRLIRRMKYHDARVLARVFGTLLAREGYPPEGVPMPELLLGVPSRAERRAEGFDHAAALARWCARELGVFDASALAVRIVDTGPFAGLSRAARQDRIRGAFRVDERLAGRHVAIVDDVLTSGATAGELARELYDTGVASVELWVLARTPAIR